MWKELWLTIVSLSSRTWSYSLREARKMREVTFSKQWIHFRRSDFWPPTSTILSGIRAEEGRFKTGKKYIKFWCLSLLFLFQKVLKKRWLFCCIVWKCVQCFPDQYLFNLLHLDSWFLKSGHSIYVLVVFKQYLFIQSPDLMC